MKSVSILSLLVLSSVVSAQWEHLRVTWTALPVMGFDEQPRTAAELSEQGWIPLSTCQDGNENFPGDRYVRSPGDNDVVLIFDGNGFIAGIQTVVPADRTLNDQYFQYSTSNWYQVGDFFGEQAYFSTAYFVDPSIICNGGRTQAEFDTQGTGNSLIFQSGPTIQDLTHIPLTQEEIIAEAVWYEHNCFPNMGIHFFQFNYDVDQRCDDSVPYQIVYDLEGNLNGIVFQHIAQLDSNRFETVNNLAVNSIMVDPPSCILDLTTTPGVKTIHVYVGEYIISCP